MLSDEWQRCLHQLTTNPQGAQYQLYRILQDEFEEKPPRLLSWWIDSGEGENRQEFVHHLLVHLCEDDFRRLRKYPVASSPPPDRWIRRVANNRIKDDLKRKRLNIVLYDLLESISAATDADFVKSHEDREAVETMHRCMERLSAKERLLVDCRAEGRSPGETATLLGLRDTPRTRKRIADATGYALEKLAKIVRKEDRELSRQLQAV